MLVLANTKIMLDNNNIKLKQFNNQVRHPAKKIIFITMIISSQTKSIC
ncbi:unnamed protein product, partial [Tenebrio molitor]